MNKSELDFEERTYTDPLANAETFFGSDSDNTAAIVIKDLTSKENIELKTDIKDPLKLAMWDTIAERMKSQGLDASNAMMRSITDKLLVYMVSHKRKSRSEIIDALKSVREHDELTRMDKLLGRGRM